MVLPTRWQKAGSRPLALVLSSVHQFIIRFEGLAYIAHPLDMVKYCPEKSHKRDSGPRFDRVDLRGETARTSGYANHQKWDSPSAAGSQREAATARIFDRKGSGEANRRCA